MNLENYSSSRDLDKVASNIQNSLTISLNISASPSRPPKKEKSDWWDENIEKLKRTSRRLFNNARTTKLDSSWEDYKTSLQIYKKEIRFAKGSNWRTFCENIESATECLLTTVDGQKESPARYPFSVF